LAATETPIRPLTIGYTVHISITFQLQEKKKRKASRFDLPTGPSKDLPQQAVHYFVSPVELAKKTLARFMAHPQPKQGPSGSIIKQEASHKVN